MNILQAQALPEDELNAKVAELAGFCPYEAEVVGYIRQHATLKDVPMPDYVKDLNAMHKVICALSSELNHGADFELYQHHLKKMLFPKGTGFGWMGKMLKATAKQQAIAFVVAMTVAE